MDLIFQSKAQQMNNPNLINASIHLSGVHLIQWKPIGGGGVVFKKRASDEKDWSDRDG